MKMCNVCRKKPRLERRVDRMKNYEDDHHKSVYFGYPQKSNLLEWLDDTMDSYWGYYVLAGREDFFAEEIFFYIKEFLGLQNLFISGRLMSRSIGND